MENELTFSQVDIGEKVKVMYLYFIFAHKDWTFKGREWRSLVFAYLLTFNSPAPIGFAHYMFHVNHQKMKNVGADPF